jgi:hypothetical protein
MEKLTLRPTAADVQAVSRPVTTIVLAVVAAAAFAMAIHARQHVRVLREPRDLLTKQVEAAGPTFSPEVAPADRQLVLRDIAGARPEARRLIDMVDGLVVFSVGDTSADGADTVGYTQFVGDHFDVRLNLAAVYQVDGERATQRLILHELGHVVDAMLVKPDLATKLDAPIPVGYGCDPGTQSPIGCAPRAERFAETFSKWCTGDIGVNLPLGYKVAPPPSLDDWGAQLVSGVGAA